MFKETRSELWTRVGGGDLAVVAFQYAVRSQQSLGRLEEAWRTGREAMRVAR